MKNKKKFGVMKTVEVMVLIGLVLSFIKGFELGLQSFSWWSITAFFWGLPLLFVVAMLGVFLLVIVRMGCDKILGKKRRNTTTDAIKIIKNRIHQNKKKCECEDCDCDS